uniref:Uncharacterized protein n=1 Tax=Ciona savignyi TaxID=51511 RepID=H2ZLP8_CIOSA
MARDTKIYVGNLSSSTTRGDLEYEFEHYGRLVNVWVAKSPPGFAYVEFEDPRDADDAIKGLDGKELHGRRIRVERSHGMPRSRGMDRDREYRDRDRPPFGASRRAFHPSDRCYNCGESGHYAYDCDLYNRRRGRSGRHRSHSRSRSHSPRRRSRRSKSYSRSRSRSRRRSYSRSRSKSDSRSRSRSSGRRSRSKTPKKSRRDSVGEAQNGRSVSRSRSRS